jgi:hypothetical protein
MGEGGEAVKAAAVLTEAGPGRYSVMPLNSRLSR